MSSRRDNSIPNQQQRPDSKHFSNQALRNEDRPTRIHANTNADIANLRLFRDPLPDEPRKDRFDHVNSDNESCNSDGYTREDTDFVNIRVLTGPATIENRRNRMVLNCLEVQDKFLSRETGEFITGIFPSRIQDDAGQPSLCSCPFSTNVDMAAWRERVGLSIEKACKYGKYVRLDQLTQHLQAKMEGCYRHEIAYNALIRQYPALDQREQTERRKRKNAKVPRARFKNGDRNVHPRNDHPRTHR